MCVGSKIENRRLNLPRKDVNISIGPNSLRIQATLSTKTYQHRGVHACTLRIIPTGRSEKPHGAVFSESCKEWDAVNVSKGDTIADAHELLVPELQPPGINFLISGEAPSAFDKSLPHGEVQGNPWKWVPWEESPRGQFWLLAHQAFHLRF